MGYWPLSRFKLFLIYISNIVSSKSLLLIKINILENKLTDWAKFKDTQ